MPRWSITTLPPSMSSAGEHGAALKRVEKVVRHNEVHKGVLDFRSRLE
jgi:hypothetical protein